MSPRWEASELRRGRSVIWMLHVHLVFVTKYRRGALSKAMLERCEVVMRDVCTDFGAELAEFDGERDHVHLLVTYPPTIQISKLVNSLKGVSSRMLRKEFGAQLRRYLSGEHLWSPSYFAGSVGGAPISVLRKYIESQKSPE